MLPRLYYKMKESSTPTEEDLGFIENNLTNPKIVAIGKIGLDYHWNKENKDLQKR